jgi:hypothetical protein
MSSAVPGLLVFPYYQGVTSMTRSFWQHCLRRPQAGSPRPRRRQPDLELLESRDLLSGFHPLYVLARPAGGVVPFSSPGPTGYTPSQIKHAYGFDQITFNNGATAGDGTGTTIAIVDAYDDPNIAHDLRAFDKQFGLPDPTFTKVNQDGGSSMPAADGGWATEIALDVEWAHAIAPGAKILLVEAYDNSESNLFAAVRYAASQPGVVAVSMSWGGGEYSGETGDDYNFQTPSGHAGVTFVVSSGDSGAPASYPAASPNVLSVGGTTLNLDGSGNYQSEWGWGGSGGGISTYESQPGYQKGVVTQSTARRTNPDVAYDADPNTGFPVYDSYNNGTGAPWEQVGGTSDAAPQWAALIAIADQGRALNGLGSLHGPSETLPKLYALASTDFHDITSGTSTGSPNYSARAGYDLVTGRGAPRANKVVADLVGSSQGNTGATQFSVSAPSSTTAGSSFTVTVTALDSSGKTYTGYTGTVQLTSSDTAAVLPGSYTFTAADAGVHTFTVTLETAGSQTVTATDAANGSVTGSATLTVNPGAPSKIAFGQQPTTTAPGAVITPAVRVRVLDAYGNLVTSDNTDQVTVALGNNPGNGTLSGTTTVTVQGGKATFSNLSINNQGNGYTLVATAAGLGRATSASFNISSSTILEDFEHSETWNVVNGFFGATAYRATWAAHDGTYGLDDYDGQDWIYRSDAAAQVKAGDTLSVWLQFAGSADGRGYFAFGASAGGTLSLVAAPDTGEFLIEQNTNWGFTHLATVAQSYQADHWYRLEVDWGTSGKIVGKLFDSDGTTLLQTVTATTTAITSGGFGFRALGSDKYWDTVTVSRGVNNFVATAGATPPGAARSSAPSWTAGSPTTPHSVGLAQVSAAPETPHAAGPVTPPFLPGGVGRLFLSGVEAPARALPVWNADGYFASAGVASGPSHQLPGWGAISSSGGDAETEPFETLG